jgi:hypothetical protein
MRTVTRATSLGVVTPARIFWTPSSRKSRMPAASAEWRISVALARLNPGADGLVDRQQLADSNSAAIPGLPTGIASVPCEIPRLFVTVSGQPELPLPLDRERALYRRVGTDLANQPLSQHGKKGTAHQIRFDTEIH